LKYQIALRNYRRGEPEIHLLAELVDPGRSAADVGAFLGAYTFFLARRCRHVYAFEPQVECARFLRRAYGPQVTVYDCALAERAGSACLAGDCAEDQSAKLVSGNDGKAVQVKTLDEFEIDDLGFLKIDAEGAEHRILQGASATIQRCKPTLLVEIEQRHTDKDINEIFRYVIDLGYRGYYYHEGRVQDLETFSVDAMQRARLDGDSGQPYINNFIFRC